MPLLASSLLLPCLPATLSITGVVDLHNTIVSSPTTMLGLAFHTCSYNVSSSCKKSSACLIDFVDPEMHTKDLHIAEAAAQAGFDCSSWAKLKRLLNAIHSATAPVKYPDRWTGSGAFKSDIYPSRWVANSRDHDRPTSVRKENNFTRSQGSQPPSFTAGTNSNRQALGERSINKRSADAIAGETPGNNKRTKKDATTSPAVAGSSQHNAIDLTSEVSAVKYQPTRLHYRNITKIFNTRRRNVNREQLIKGETTGIVAKIASKQRASLYALQVDRETLKNRWEVDEHLRQEHITDRLAELNQHFTMAEEALKDSLAVIEHTLLK